ncbi:acyl-CoA dehydrogenase family protein [Nocardia sp. NPDC059246]|uniref:acyl-CoA dehydrogenase family protein n=1 Tax=unclassified Nocardia TaxID=2637762 RepID=UPI0036BBB604
METVILFGDPRMIEPIMADTTNSTIESDSPTRAELVARATALVPLLREDAAEADQERRLTQRVVDAITEAGLLQLMTPRRLGGLETDLSTVLEVVGELGRGDMSTAWVAGVLNFTAWQVGTLGKQAQDDVWASNPRARICSVLAPTAEYERADGGIVVTGRWPVASGSQISEWAFLSVPMSFGPQGPELSAALIPMSELTVLDTWNPAGVRGSASNTIVGKEIFVPEHRLMPIRPALNGERPESHSGEPLYISSFAGIASIATLAPQLGLGSAVFEAVTDQSQGRPVPTAGLMDQSESSAFQMRIADAGVRIDTAWLLARQVAAEVDAAAATGGLPDDGSRGRARMYSCWAAELVHDAVETLISESGASALMDGSPLQRMWRDNSTAARHTAYRIDPVRELYGRILLDKGPGNALLF